MLEGRDILAFTYADWRASWSTPQQIMSRLAPANRVLFVDQPRSFLYNLKPPDPQGAGQWEGPRMQEAAENLFVLHPPHCFLPTGSLPYAAGRAALRVNGRLMARIVARAMRRLNMQRPVLWNFSPMHGDAALTLPAALRIYDICDEWGSYVPHAAGRRLLAWIEGRLIQGADLVFTGTGNMAEARAGLHPELHVVHHGADFEHFARAALPETEIPEDIAGLPQPVIGSVGVLDPQRFDTEMILHMARAWPEWSIALVGPPRADMNLDRLREQPNVYLLGNKPLSALPGYLKGMRVALIPYQVNDATRGIYPLKLQEYLAAGLPVVSAALPAVLPYQDVVEVASSPADFVQHVHQSLEDRDPGRRQARQEVARRNSWEARVREKSDHVIRLLARTEAEQGSETP